MVVGTSITVNDRTPEHLFKISSLMQGGYLFRGAYSEGALNNRTEIFNHSTLCSLRLDERTMLCSYNLNFIIINVSRKEFQNEKIRRIENCRVATNGDF